MNRQNNNQRNQDMQPDYKQNKQSQYTTGQNQYSQGTENLQNMQYGQYGQQQQQRSRNFNQPTSQQFNEYQANQINQQSTTQQAKMIKNPEKNIVRSPEMNDRDYLNDILATEKYLTDGFNTFTSEASHTELHNDVKTILNDTHSFTRDLFNLMFKDGFYSFQGASNQEVQQTQQKFSKYLSQQDPYGTNNMSF